MHDLEQLRAAEQRVLDKIRQRSIVARQVHAEEQASMTFGERAADRLAHFAGSWPFILMFLGFCGTWVLVNSVALALGAWDPYPFILLNLILSLLAGLQAPVIMMSQNRQEARDRLRSEADYEVNLKAELEIQGLHQKMDDLREQKWQTLLTLQQQQLDLLRDQVALLQRAGAASQPDGVLDRDHALPATAGRESRGRSNRP
jgi:uncharacterized membrane protein